MILMSVAIFFATLFYNIVNGMSSIFIARGLIKAGALFDAIRNVVYILILSFVILQVKDNYWLLVPLFFGYFSGMLISGVIVNRMKLGAITVSALINGDKRTAKLFAERLSANGVMNTSFIGTGSRSKTVMIVIIDKRKRQDHIVHTIRELAKTSKLDVKITVAETAEWL